MASLLFTAAIAAVGTAASSHLRRADSGAVNSTTCNGRTYVYQELAGYGFVASDARDKYGDTLGGLGSAIHIDQTSWRRTCNGTYTGTLWSLPDRGW